MFGAHPQSRRNARIAIVLALVMLFAAVNPLVVAVHDEGLFELGNGVNPTVAGSGDIVGSGQAGPDWADIFDANGNVTNLFGGITATFLKDNTSQASAVDDTVFSAGSAKNNDDPTNWTWDAGNVPAKDDLSNSYAYAIINPANGHLIVYVGMERLDPSGDSHLDIEFFQDDVGLDEAAPCNDPGADATPCHFVGNRTHHDVLVSMDYTKGGGLGSLVVHIWNATTDFYDEVETVTGEGCNGVAAANLTADSICGFNNGGSINGGPWPNFDRHGSVITLIPGNGFTEFGLDLTAAAGNETPCVSTILAKSRSSQSFTAELKDFSGPFPFAVCGGEIDIVPDDVNEVGQPHTFSIFVNSTIAGVSAAAPDGTKPTVNLTASNGASVSLISNTCSSPGTVSGVCTVTFTSPTAGKVTGHANVTFTSGGVTQSFQTNGAGSSSGDAVKRFVNATIQIAPSAVNEVRAAHTFQVNVSVDNGTGLGFVPLTDGHVTVVLTPSNGASVALNTTASTCDDAGDNLNSTGNCIVVFTSPTGGIVTGAANISMIVDGVTLVRATNGTFGNSANATKRFVNATIEIGPALDTNSVNETHTFQVNVTVDDGSGSGLVPLTNGHVTVVLTPSGGATPTIDATASTCDDAGDNLDALGHCTLVFTSPTPGTVVGNANITIVVEGVTLARQTNGTFGNSGNATKIFVAGSIEWTKVDNAGALLAGAVFTVCQTHVWNSATGTFDSVPITCSDVTDNVAPDVNATGGGFRLVDLVLGRYTVQEKTPPPGFTADPANRTVEINQTSPSGSISTAFRDERPIVKLAGFGYENAPTVEPTAGVVTGQTNYTIRMHNYGTATAVLATFLNITGNASFLSGTGPGLSAPAGGTSCVSPCAVSWTGVSIAPGTNVTLVARITYTGAADGSIILAQLAASYTTGLDAFIRTPSGAPASISFTVQAD